jgi:hypothetical protein
MNKLKSVEEIKAYYDFCINMEIIAMHNVWGGINEDAYNKAINDVCKYLDMDPTYYTYDCQPNTETELSWRFGESRAIFWVLEDVLKEESQTLED